MPQTAAAPSRRLSHRELKEFALTAGPAVTVYLASDLPGGPNRRLPARLAKLADDVEARCAGRGMERKECADLVRPVREQAAQIGTDVQGPGLVLFRSPESFRYYWLPREVDAAVLVSDNFHVRPILDLLEEQKRFFVLALAQKELRLLRCSAQSSEEVASDSLPRNLAEYTGSDKPDHNARNQPPTAPGSFSVGTEKEQKDEHLLHYFTAVNRAVNELLKNDEKAMLVLAGVDFELAIYRRVNTYPHLCPQAVQGGATSLRGTELHKRALECLAACRRERTNEILARHDKQTGGASNAPVREIVKAAHEGRVAHLLVGEKAEAFGNFDEATHRVRQHKQQVSGDEDLINAAAIQTVLHAGDVLVLAAEKVPGGRPMAAVMRY